MRVELLRDRAAAKAQGAVQTAVCTPNFSWCGSVQAGRQDNKLTSATEDKHYQAQHVKLEGHYSLGQAYSLEAKPS